MIAQLRAVSLSVAFALGVSSRGAAQSQEQAQDADPFCLRAGRGDQCRSFLLIDRSMNRTLNSTSCCSPSRPDFDKGVVVWRLGAGRNLSTFNAIGILAGVATNHVSGAMPDVLEVAYRRWLNAHGREALELSAGLGQAMVSNPGKKAIARGPIVAVAFMPMETIGLTGRADFFTAAGTRRRAFLGGIRFSSGAAPIATVAMAVALVILFLTTYD
jgi:hypothetical protein